MRTRISNLLLLLRKGKSVNYPFSLQQYQEEREAVLRELELERLSAKDELLEATILPTAMYNRRVNRAREDFLRVEQELWANHLQRVNDKSEISN